MRLRNSVVALLVLDLIVGAWMYLHAPEFLPKLSLANFAVFGISGVLRLLPDDDRAALARKPIAALRTGLSRMGAPRTLAALIFGALVIAAFTSSVHVQSSGGATAQILVVEGSESEASLGALAADTMTLAQSGGEVIDQRAIPPWGESVWAYTSTHVSRGNRIALPWRPVRWVYPVDFDEQVTLFVLPTTTAVMTLTNQHPEFVLSDVGGREIVRGVVSSDGARIQFSDRDADQNTLSAAWVSDYRRWLLAGDTSALHADSALVIGLLAADDTARRSRALRRHEETARRLGVITGRDSAWRRAARIRPARPLHKGEKVRYAFDHAGTPTGPFEVVLDRNPFLLLIDSTVVDKRALATRP